jgi:hypothetical protein
MCVLEIRACGHPSLAMGGTYPKALPCLLLAFSILECVRWAWMI